MAAAAAVEDQVEGEGEGKLLVQGKGDDGPEAADYTNLNKDQPYQSSSDKHNQAIQLVGFGRYQILAGVFLGLAEMADSIELFLISFILPSAERELCMTAVMKGWLAAIVFFGLLVGNGLWGSLSDAYGRKKTVLVAVLINLLFGIISAFSPNYHFFCACRFFCGIGIGGSIPVLLPYFMENCPNTRRGLILTLLHMSWSVGPFYAALFAYIIIPVAREVIVVEGLQLSSWRLFMIICAIPCFIAFIGICFMDESPLFLMGKGRLSSAFQVYYRMYKMNNGEPDETINNQLSAIVLQGTEDNGMPFEDKEWDDSIERFMKHISRTYGYLLSNYRQILVILNFVWFTYLLSYYGMSSWFPEYLKRIEQLNYEAQTTLVTKNNFTKFNLTRSNGEVENALFDRVQLNNLDFSNLTFLHVSFYNCDFKHCSFNKIWTRDTHFVNTTFTSTSFNNTDLWKAKFKECTFSDSEFTNTRNSCQVDFGVPYHENRIYRSVLLATLTSLPAALLSGFLLDRFGRRKPMLIFSLVGGIAVLSLIVTMNEIVITILNCVFQAFMLMILNGQSIMTGELYPSIARSSGIGVNAVFGRVGAILANILFGNLINVSKAIPILVTAICVVCGGFLTWLLPESKDYLI